MNKHWKNVILVLTLIVGVLAMSMTTQAAGKGKYFASGKLYYHTLSKNTVEVCATKQTTGILTIPASVSYKGTKYKVVKIADYKFGGESVPVSDDTVNGSTPNLNLQGDHTYRYDRVDGKNIPSDVNWLCNSKISKLVLPSTITYIGDGAFSGCKKLKNVEFAKKYKKLTIGSNAFVGTNMKNVLLPSGTYELKENALGTTAIIKFPASVKKIGAGVVNSATKKVIVDKKNKNFKLKDNMLYSYDEKTLIGVTAKVSSNIILSSKTTRIAEKAFAGSKVETVTLNANISEISRGAFASCKNLLTVAGTEKVTKIGYGAFYGCGRLNNIGALSNLTEIERAAFWETENCPVTISAKVTVDDYAFSGAASKTFAKVSVAANDTMYSVVNGLLIKTAGDKKVVILQAQDMEKVDVAEGVTDLAVAVGGSKCKEITLPASLKNQSGKLSIDGGMVIYKSVAVPTFGYYFDITNVGKNKITVVVPKGTSAVYKFAMDNAVSARDDWVLFYDDAEIAITE